MTEETQTEVNEDNTVVEPQAELDTNTEAVVTEEVVTEEVAEPKVVSQEEFNKLYFQYKQAERDRDAAQAAQAPAQAPAQAAPTLEAYDYDDEKFQAASIAYQVDKQVQSALATVQTNNVAAQAEQKSQAISATFNQRAVEYAASQPGYEQAIAASNGATYPTHIQQAVLLSEAGPQIDHMLLSDPAKLQSLSAMQPTEALMEIGRMSMNMNIAKPPAAAARVSNAPAPIETATGGGSAASNYAYNENMSMEEYYAAHQASKRG